MSYDCDKWNTKELVDFRVPVASLFTNQRRDWHPHQLVRPDGLQSFQIIDTEIAGVVDGGWLHVKYIRCSGEGSGTAMNWILEPAFHDSRGRLVASCVWEGGDIINRLVVDEGKVTWENIEI